ncbi:MAG: hypothetical protein IJS35_01555 [Firmicutes bacterium]|nr:hypothetical protein [Bacillota bacterium]
MKRKISLILCLLTVISCLAFTACGSKKDLSNSKYVGTWKCESMSLMEESEALEEDWTITLNPDGTGKSESEGEITDFKWTETDEGFKCSGDLKLKFTDDGEGVKTSFMKVDLHFTKQ